MLSIDQYLLNNNTSADARLLYFDKLDGCYRSFWIGRFTNMFIQEGKKETVENAFLQAVMQTKQFFIGKLNFQHTFTYVVNWAKPWFEMRKFIKRGELQDYPKLMLKDKGYAKSVRQMSSVSKKSFEYSLWEKMFDSAVNMFTNKTGAGLHEWRRDLLWSIVDIRYKLKSTRYNKAMGVRFFKSLKTHRLRRIRLKRELFFLQYFKERIFDKAIWPGQFKKHLELPRSVEAVQFQPAIKGKQWVLNPKGIKLFKRWMLVSKEYKVMFQDFKTGLTSADFRSWRLLKDKLNRFYWTWRLKAKELEKSKMDHDSKKATNNRVGFKQFKRLKELHRSSQFKKHYVHA